MYGIPGLRERDELVEGIGVLMYDPGRRRAPGAAARRPTKLTSATQTN